MQKYAPRVKYGKTRRHFWLDFCSYQISLQHASNKFSNASNKFEYHIALALTDSVSLKKVCLLDQGNKCFGPILIMIPI